MNYCLSRTTPCISACGASEPPARRRHAPTLCAGFALCLLFLSGVARAASPVVISQIYAGGGNGGAAYTHDYVELFNRGDVPVDIEGWSLQYASATGNGLFSQNGVVSLSGTLQPGRYSLVRLASSGPTGGALPTPDIVAAGPNLSGTGGKVILAVSATPLSCNGSASQPCDAGQTAQIVDRVSYGAAAFFEGTGAAPGPGNALALRRRDDGCTDRDDNAADFEVATPAPRNSAASASSCAGAPPIESATSARIRDVQGGAHRSPLLGRRVREVFGIVTALRSNGFYVQDPVPDELDATSEGLFVFTNAPPFVVVGDAVELSGSVAEFRPGGSGGANNLSITELTGPSIVVVGHSNALPPPVLLGSGGRAIPFSKVDDDALGDVEIGGRFEPDDDAVDFYESLEGMRVEIRDAVVVGPRTPSGELPVLADDGIGSSLRTPRGGIVIRSDDFNPERLILDNALTQTPAAEPGDRLSSVVALVDYSAGGYRFQTTSTPTVTRGDLSAETTPPRATATRLTLASLNVENLDPRDGERFGRLAVQIAANLRSPDILSLAEVQDNDGATNSSVTDGDMTYGMLIDAIVAAGGPIYAYRDIAPVDDADGGEPGGNIRVGFLFNPARVQFIDRPGGAATASVEVIDGPSGPHPSFSPGRIEPTHAAFANSRKPLVGEFAFNGQRLLLIANHFVSKGGDDALFGRFQPPIRASEVQRNAQAAIVGRFVERVLGLDPGARIVVLGDLNDFQFSNPLQLLEAAGLKSLITCLPRRERYTYLFEGNSQVLDHILVSPALAAKARPTIDVVHMNAEFIEQATDHDAPVASFHLPASGARESRPPRQVPGSRLCVP